MLMLSAGPDSCCTTDTANPGGVGVSEWMSRSGGGGAHLSACSSCLTPTPCPTCVSVSDAIVGKKCIPFGNTLVTESSTVGSQGDSGHVWMTRGS